MLNITHYQRMKIKTTMRYHLTPVRMDAIKKSTNNKSWRGFGEKGNFLLCWWECKLVQPLWRTVWRFLKDLEIEVPYDPAIPLLGMYIAALFIIARMWKQPRCPLTNGKESCGTYTQWNITQLLKSMHLIQF